jgi:hypothetical protein
MVPVILLLLVGYTMPCEQGVNKTMQAGKHHPHALWVQEILG